MDIILCEHAGFCYGVRRAIDITLAALRSHGKVYTFGPLVHNPQAVKRLEESGVRVCESLEACVDGTLIIPSHGLPPLVIDAAKEKGLNVVDATCPHVGRAQQLARKAAREGYQVLIVGDRGHSEVEGLLGWAGPQAIVVQDVDDLYGAEISSKAAIVVQTTQSFDMLRDIAGAVLGRTRELVIYNTICGATEERQNAARDLTSRVDAMVIIGGRASANTRRLWEVCKASGRKAYWIEDAGELDAGWFREVKAVGVTAGASTPNWVIEEVIRKMRDLDQEKLDQEKSGEFEGDQLAAVNSEGGPGDMAAGEGASVAQAPAEGDKTSEGPNGEGQQFDVSSLGSAGDVIEKGQIIKGTVVRVEPDQVLIDFGQKSEGIIPISELSTRRINSPAEVVSVGDEIDVYVLQVEDEQGNTILSKRRADQEKAWERLTRALTTGETIEGTATAVVKGGVVVDVGTRGFVPASHVGLRPVADLSSIVGTHMRLKVLEADRSRNNVVLSQRLVLEQEQAEARERAFETLKEGDIKEGTVKRVVNFGAFVDIGDGVEGLLHVSDMSWGRVKDPKDVVSEGDHIKVMVLGVDKERRRISLGLKQTLPDPWLDIEKRYPVGSIVKGKVTKLMNFGAFVELEPGVEGLVHISQLADRHVAKPEEVVEPGQEVKVKVVSVKPQDHRIGLSIKEAEPPEERVEKSEKQESRNPRESYVAGDENEHGPTLGDVFGDLFEKEK
ncbi:MAG TPA: bifunctional 4-hydroxy-3-methylbut-2-enyl diphosphate reductase/30S ribosomal protein S1 [Firmicutes bacterium]|nr:bifunctional 4-hydroxy-3-methylbut-2-enyl diphosphate reductase/30S ribosomal protein S1 [Bacillota bacterium]